MQNLPKTTGKQSYNIDFHALEAGKSYSYDFTFGDDFFGRWPESEVQSGAGTIHVGVLRHASMMELEVEIDGRVEIACDRCMETFPMPVHFEGSPVVKITDAIPEGEEQESDGDILWVSPSENNLDLGQYIYESIILSLPFQRVHPELSACNPDMLDRFQIVTEEEFEQIAAASTGEQEEGPFAALAALKEEEE